MTDGATTIRIVFKAGPAQTKNHEESYKIDSAELERLERDFRMVDTNKTNAPTTGVYDVVRAEPNNHVPTRLILRFADVLYIG